MNADLCRCACNKLYCLTQGLLYGCTSDCYESGDETDTSAQDSDAHRIPDKLALKAGSRSLHAKTARDKGFSYLQ